MHIHPIPAFDDNYFWIIHNGKHAIIVDPGDAPPVQDYLDQHQLNLCAILLTHHHPDHIGGVDDLLQSVASSSPVGLTQNCSSKALRRRQCLSTARRSNAAGTILRKSCPVYGPLADQQSGRISAITNGVQQNAAVVITELHLNFNVIEVPGHTSTHIAYYCAELASLFCGDTLFAGGCGRLFEGTSAQMVNSLHKIAALPAHTKIYCAHEYTLSNLCFALAVEPNNRALQARFNQVDAARKKGIATVPSQLDVELQTNPFLRCTSAEIIHTLQANKKITDITDEISVFAAVRQWKNHF